MGIVEACWIVCRIRSTQLEHNNGHYLVDFEKQRSLKPQLRTNCTPWRQCFTIYKKKKRCETGMASHTLQPSLYKMHSRLINFCPVTYLLVHPSNKRYFLRYVIHPGKMFSFMMLICNGKHRLQPN